MKLRTAMAIGDDAYERLDTEVMREVDAAVEFARTSPEPEVEVWEDVIYA